MIGCKYTTSTPPAAQEKDPTPLVQLLIEQADFTSPALWDQPFYVGFGHPLLEKGSRDLGLTYDGVPAFSATT